MPPAMSAEFPGPSSSLLAHVHKPGGKCPAGNKRHEIQSRTSLQVIMGTAETFWSFK
jgi:hypothetical protein